MVEKVTKHVEIETKIVSEREAKLLKLNKKETKAATSRLTLSTIETKIAAVMKSRLGRGTNSGSESGTYVMILIEFVLC